MRAIGKVGVGAALVAAAIVGQRARADVSPPEVVKAMNQDTQSVWDRLRPLAEARIRREAIARVASVSFQSSHLEAKVTRVRKLELGLKIAPGLKHIATNRLDVAIPLRGTWRASIEVDVKVKGKLGPIKTSFEAPIKLEVKDLSIAARIDLDDTDPLRIQVKKVHPPKVTFDLDVSSSKHGIKEVLDLVSPLADLVAHHVAKGAIDDLAPQLRGLKGYPGDIPAKGAPLLQDSGTPVPFAEIVGNVETKIRRDQLPHGTLVEARMDVGTDASWATDYGPGGGGTRGKVIGWEGTGDSAIWSGHYLASQALRFHATQDPAALDNVRHVVGGIGKLLDVNGGTGLLARVAAPEASPIGQETLKKDRPRRQVIGGVPWVGRQGGDGITRDQYSGVFFGLGMTFDLVNDKAVRDEAGARIVQMLDYLVAHDWMIDEDRIPLSQPNGSLPTIWSGGALQVLNNVLLGERVAPGRYAADLARISRITQCEWLTSWANTFNVDGYFKFNLSHVNYEQYFRHETDPKRFADMARSFRIMRNYVGHHRNAHFDLITATTFDPAQKATLFPQSREVVRRFLARPHRHVAPAVVDLSGVTYQTIKMRTFDVVGGTAGAHVLKLPSEPLDLVLREPAHTFLWQRDPFEAAVAGKGQPKSECLGIDLTLPYWMGRDRGAF